MLNKTLLAISVFAIASAANSATLNPGADATAAFVAATPSTQNVTTADAFPIGAAISPILHLDATYLAGDNIQITYSGAILDEGFTHGNDALIIGQTAGAAPACIIANQSISFAGLQGNTATYTFGTTDGNTENCSIALAPISVDGASLGTVGSLSYAIQTNRGFGQLEAVAATPIVTVGGDEVTVTVVGGGFDDLVNVNNNRNSYVNGAADILLITLADANGGVATTPELTAGTTMSLSGDFSWDDAVNAQGVRTFPSIAVGAAAGGNIGGAGPVFTDTSISWVATTAGQYSVTITPPTVAGTLKTLKASAYILTTNIGFVNGVDAVARVQAETDLAGGHLLNGANITALGIPNSAKVTPFLWVQNAGAQAGAISVDVRCEGITTVGIDAGIAAAFSNTKIDGAVTDAVALLTTCNPDSRYDAQITVNAPVNAITVNASYKVTTGEVTDRLGLETTDSLNGQL